MGLEQTGTVSGAKYTQCTWFISLFIAPWTDPRRAGSLHPFVISVPKPLPPHKNELAIFLHQKRATLEKKFFFSRDRFNPQNWALILLKTSSNSLYSASATSLSVSRIWTWLQPFFPLVWETFAHYFYLPRRGLKSLTLHLTLGARPDPFPNNVCSPLLFLGPRRKTHKKAVSWPLVTVTFQFCVLWTLLLCSLLWKHQEVLGSPGPWRENSQTSCQVARSWFAHDPQTSPPLSTGWELRGTWGWASFSPRYHPE